jgi:hypothetical protein
MSQLLAPSATTILPPTTTDEWFRPIHVWTDGLTQSGAPWEILTLPSRSGGTFDLYSKSGNLEGFHTSFSLDRATGFGIVVLMTGRYTDATGIAAMAAEKYFHPAFKSALTTVCEEIYSGTYKSAGTNEVVISLQDNALWTNKIIINGTDFLKAKSMGYKVQPVALWPTGRTKREFRCVVASVMQVRVLLSINVIILLTFQLRIRTPLHKQCATSWMRTILGFYRQCIFKQCSA